MELDFVRIPDSFRDIKRYVGASTHLRRHFDIDMSRRTAGIFISLEFTELLQVSNDVRAISHNSIF